MKSVISMIFRIQYKRAGFFLIFFAFQFALPAGKTGIPSDRKIHKQNSIQFERYHFSDKKIRWVSDQRRVLSQIEIDQWAYAQGLDVSENSDLYGLNNQNGLIFFPPGLGFTLYSENPESKTGWMLVLDIAVLKEKKPLKDKNEKLTSSYSRFEKTATMEVFIDGIFYKQIELGYGKKEHSPVVIPIPYIRSREGCVNVDLKLTNYPDNFGILYDAILKK